jgi:hypothetical protein
MIYCPTDIFNGRIIRAPYVALVLRNHTVHMHLKENKCHEKNGSSGNVKVSFSLTYYRVVITEKKNYCVAYSVRNQDLLCIFRRNQRQ